MALIETLLPATRPHLVTVAHTAALVEAARLLSTMSTSLVVVCNPQGQMFGVVTKSDVVRQISHCEGCSCTTAVFDVMTRDVVACRPDHDIYDIWLLMKDRRLKQIPVCNRASEPLGLLYANDVLEALLREREQEELLLRDYVMGIGYH